MRYQTSKSGDEQISFKEYVDRMKEGRQDIHYIIGESIAAVSSSGFLESLRKKGLEVLYMVDPMDEYSVQQLEEFAGKKLKAVTMRTRRKRLRNSRPFDAMAETFASNADIQPLR